LRGFNTLSILDEHVVVKYHSYKNYRCDLYPKIKALGWTPTLYKRNLC
jgi:hypothetical protein